LCEELEQRLRALDPAGQLLGVGIDSSGLPKFRVKLDSRVRAQGRELVRAYESRALERCELCGGAGQVHAGAIVTARCDHCV
jgi:hypothetical protein